MKQLLAILLLTLLLSACTTTGSTSGRVTVHGGDATVSIAFSDHDRRLIQDYYAGKRKRLPPGLAKKHKLPPGLAKRKRLPPGLRHDPLPPGLARKLQRLPDNYIRVKIGPEIVLMDRHTQVVFDIIVGVD